MHQIHNGAALLLLLFGLLAFLDGVYLHLWRYRLFAWDESRREHLIHSLRATLFPATAYLLFAVRAQGWLLWLGVAVAGADLLLQAWDLVEERLARRGFGGLSSFEYSLHVWLTGLHVAALSLTLAARPGADWGAAAAFAPGFTSFGVEVAWFLIPGAIVGAILHFALLHPRLRRGKRPPESMNRSREPGVVPLF